MLSTRTVRRWAGVLLCAVMVSAPVGVAPASAGEGVERHQSRACFGATTTGTVEQARLLRPEPQAILRDSGADERVAHFAAALCRSRSRQAAHRTVVREGRALWSWATDRAQGRRPVQGDLPGDDDRPLYWARVAMTSLLDQWRYRHSTSLTEVFEAASRGERSLSRTRGAHRLVLTAFDPYALDYDVRRSNPSGSLALRLDGRRLWTGQHWERVNAAIFPVRWDDFSSGELERTLYPLMQRGSRGPDAIITASEGSPGEFDLEYWYGATRGSPPDNENLFRPGTIPIQAGIPTVVPQPQFTHSTLPLQRMQAGGIGPDPVIINTQLIERDPATGEDHTTYDGPTPGWIAVEGSTGSYLSNEMAYRAALLRDAVGFPEPVGHVHLPVLGAPTGPGLSDSQFEARREEILAQSIALLRLAT